MPSKADEISRWIASEVRRAGMRGAVLGLSGGIDSAVTALLCSEALGQDVLGVIMPCHSQRQDEEHARLIASRFDIVTTTIRLEDTYKTLEDVLAGATDTARANIKARLRMSVLYAFANTLSYLVVGTGNKTELMLGYFTKYGDGGVDILPLGDMYKTEVRQLARDLGLPDEIVKKPPSAGLWDGQTDEGEIGLTYEEIDRALEAIEAGREEAMPPATLNRVGNMVERSNHKRDCPPIFPEP
jgi:NAD+ synthase